MPFKPSAPMTILSLLIHTVLTLPSPVFNEHIQAWRSDLCQSASGVDSKCAGTADVKASNILACPSQASAVGILCGGANSKQEAGGVVSSVRMTFPLSPMDNRHWNTLKNRDAIVPGRMLDPFLHWSIEDKHGPMNKCARWKIN
ncbi:MAG: hypothetical protein L6R36_005444 [Xanthoria steineri]|nr:MAG: hypothetical protein L6R36_005444 [Xanthoria steineri]